MSAAQAVTATFTSDLGVLHPDRLAGGRRKRHGHVVPGRHQLRRRLLRGLRPGTVVTPDAHAGRRLRLRGLERGLHRHRRLPGHHERRQVGHRHLRPGHVHAHRDHGGLGQRHRHLLPRRHQLRRRLLRALQPRDRRALTATAASGSSFGGWSGACSGTAGLPGDDGRHQERRPPSSSTGGPHVTPGRLRPRREAGSPLAPPGPRLAVRLVPRERQDDVGRLPPARPLGPRAAWQVRASATSIATPTPTCSGRTRRPAPSPPGS